MRQPIEGNETPEFMLDKKGKPIEKASFLLEPEKSAREKVEKEKEAAKKEAK